MLEVVLKDMYIYIIWSRSRIKIIATMIDSNYNSISDMAILTKASLVYCHGTITTGNVVDTLLGQCSSGVFW